MRPRRRGHGRPVGTLTAVMRFSWRSADEPRLGDIAFEVPPNGNDPHELGRAFLLVGIEETASRAYPYRLIFERLEFGRGLAGARLGDPWWTWSRDPR